MPIERKIFVEAPACRAMIHNDTAYRVTTKCVVAPSEFATAKAHIAHDDIVGVDFSGFTANANAIAGSGLTSDCNERVIYRKSICERDDSGNTKHNNAQLGDDESFSQTAGSTVSERGDFVNFSASATGC